MPKIDELRTELRALRKDAVKPVSRMKKGDISAEIERMRGYREETPAAAAVPSAPQRMAKAAAESIKEAKRHEFPVAPAPAAKKKAPAAPAAPAKKGMTKAKMRAMLEEMTSDEE